MKECGIHVLIRLLKFGLKVKQVLDNPFFIKLDSVYTVLPITSELFRIDGIFFALKSFKISKNLMALWQKF